MNMKKKLFLFTAAIALCFLFALPSPSKADDEEHVCYTDPEYSSSVRKMATTKNRGLLVYKCPGCGCDVESIIIYSPKTITFDKKYAYNGKTQKPEVILKNEKNEVISDQHYYVIYPKSMKKIGAYTITLKFYKEAPGDRDDLEPDLWHRCYDGTMKETFYIYPQKLKTPKVKKASKTRVKVTWKNIAGESGYQISKSTSPDKTGKIYTVKTTKGKSTLIKAKRRKTYYYKVRAYTKSKSQKLYGAWSDVKKYKLK